MERNKFAQKINKADCHKLGAPGNQRATDGPADGLTDGLTERHIKSRAKNLKNKTIQERHATPKSIAG